MDSRIGSTGLPAVASSPARAPAHAVSPATCPRGRLAGGSSRGVSAPPTSTSRSPRGVTVATHPGSTTTVEMSSSSSAGPCSTCPGRRSASAYDGVSRQPPSK
eukprot:scaffold144_cov132-Isochrysis_galbana.AAC.1